MLLELTREKAVVPVGGRVSPLCRWKIPTPLSYSLREEEPNGTFLSLSRLHSLDLHLMPGAGELAHWAKELSPHLMTWDQFVGPMMENSEKLHTHTQTHMHTHMRTHTRWGGGYGFLIFIDFTYVCVWVFCLMCVCTLRACLVSDPQGLEFTESCELPCARSQIQVLCKSNECSYTLSQLSRPINKNFNKNILCPGFGSQAVTLLMNCISSPQEFF